MSRSLRERPHKGLADADPKVLERNMQHFDDQLRALDLRRIAQQTEVAEGATDSETIANLRTAVNALITALNASALTED